MEYSENTLKQLTIIKWLLVLIVVGILITMSCVAAFVILTSDLVENGLNASSSCEDINFRDKVSDWVGEGKTEAAIKLATERMKSHPNDQDAYWFRGLAYYLQKEWQPAIEDFNKVEVLMPSWKEGYVDPYRIAAQAKLAKH